MRSMRNATLAPVLLMVALLLTGACGGDDDGESSDTTGSSAATTATTGEGPDPSDVAGPPAPTTGTKPAVEVPEGDPPTELQIEDLVEGTGTEATEGSSVTVHYVGVAWSTGEQFDASWDSGQPFTFTLGAGNVIAGWDQGVAGMKVGGRRQLVIPPELGYGASGQGDAIGPNETLIFAVDLLSVG